MTLATAALIGSTMLTVLLCARDRALGDEFGERLLLAGAWVVTGVAFYLTTLDDTGSWGGTTVLLTACAATLGRPALIMDQVLVDETKDDAVLRRRGRLGQVAVFLVIGVLAFRESA